MINNTTVDNRPFLGLDLAYNNKTEWKFFPYSLSLPATNKFLLLILLSSISLHILLLVHHSITRLFILSTSYCLAYKSSYSSIPTLYLSATHHLLTLIFGFHYHSSFLSSNLTFYSN